MKKISILSSIACAMLVMLTTACSNEDSTNGKGEYVQAAQFRIVEEDFGADNQTTRAVSAKETPTIAELNDCEAETSIENDPTASIAARTRSVTTPVHYTIRAYDGSALRGELKGTFSGSTFTPDTSTPNHIELSYNRTYTFVCFNDKVTPNGNQLEVALADAGTARIGRVQVAIGTTDKTITIVSKHAGVRVRTQMVAKKDIPAISAALQTTANIPQTVSYDPATGSYTATNSAPMTAEANNFAASTETKYSASAYGKNYAYTSTADYHYILPGTDLAALKLNFTGGILFREALNGTVQPAKTSKTVVSNETYMVKVKMMPSFLYLMSDGTVGKFKDTTFGGGTKTPIAVVIDKNKHMAVALKDATPVGLYPFTWTNPAYAYLPYNYLNTNTHSVDMSHPETSLTTDATSGKDETWDPSYTTSSVNGDKVKGKNDDFSPFKTSADYGNSITYTGTPALTWYLPSHSDFRVLYNNLGFGDRSAVITVKAHYLPDTVYGWYSELMNDAFTSVGGTAISGRYWSSTLFYQSSPSTYAAGGWMMATVPSLRWTYFPYQNAVGHTRPFVEY